ncbi:MAG: diaminopimelate decarboxylase [Prevotellaceae bacterium]|nr:diaminopimelate decarboxylase [Candidatus Colivivens equi]
MLNTIKQLIEKNGTPFYLFDEKGFVDNYKKLENTFRTVYPNYQISYSYKTNYTPFVCQLVKSMGGYAEVVSDMEYTLAKKLGYKNSQIVYNGPSKGAEMYEHIENGGILNIDSLDEAKRVVSYCKLHSEKQYTCGLRINMDLGANFISRFGLEAGSPEMNETITIIKETENLQLIGLHCHISRCRGVEAWAKRAEIMLEMADKLVEGVPQYISLGSGMFADMADYLKDQFGGSSVPTYDDYCKSTIMPFVEHYKDSEKKPMLFTEPGTTVVARYLSFVSKVLSVKQIRGRWIANMDGDYHNLGEICTMKKLPTHVIAGGQEQKHYDKIDIMGFTCLEQDVMVPEWTGNLAEGDVMVFDNCGGYSIVSKPQFIKPQSAMFAKRVDNSIMQIMRAETFDDVFGKFSFEF